MFLHWPELESIPMSFGELYLENSFVTYAERQFLSKKVLLYGILNQQSMQVVKSVEI